MKEQENRTIFATHSLSRFSVRSKLIRFHSQTHIQKTHYAYILLFYKIEPYFTFY